MALPSNVLQQVTTYQESNLAFLQNLNCFISLANTKFKDFDKLKANLGSSVTFDLPPRYTTANSLVASFQPSAQRAQTLTCSQSANTAYAFSAEQFIFNVREYMEKFGKSAMMELATSVEIDVAKNANSSVRNAVTGNLVTDSGPFRFYGDGSTPISSYNRLADMIARYKNFGAVKQGIKVILPDTKVPAIVGSGLNQFTINRNNESAMSWEIGSFGTPPVEYYQSNLLPIHQAGNVGNDATELTVVSTTTDSSGAVTSITFSGAGASDNDAVKSGDLFQFVDGVADRTDMRFLTFVGHAVSDQPVQFRATADAASNGGGQVTVTLTPPLQVTAGANQNINTAIVAGMKVTALPNHRCGLVIGGDALFLAMPTLPDQMPFPTANKSDPDTGVSMRQYYGTLFGQNQQGFVHDVLWGSTLVPEYAMRIAFPVN
jgi:hypothetical protein